MPMHGDTTTPLKHILAFLRMMLLTVTKPLEGCKAEPVTVKVGAQSSQPSPAPCHKLCTNGTAGIARRPQPPHIRHVQAWGRAACAAGSSYPQQRAQSVKGETERAQHHAEVSGSAGG